MRADHKLVIDTNIWISRLLAPNGTAAKAVEHGLSWGIPLMSEETLTELSEVLSWAKFDRYVTREDRQEFLRLLGGIVRTVPITQRIAACRDPRDDKFLDVALNGEAHLILTGDRDLLELHPFHGIEILSPANFLMRPIDQEGVESEAPTAVREKLEKLGITEQDVEDAVDRARDRGSHD